MKQKSLKMNAIFNLLKSFMSIVFPIVSFPYASRVLMPEGIGKVNFINSIIEYFILIAVLGINSYASREAAKIRDNKVKLSKFAKEMLLINFISTGISYLALAICFFIVPKFSEYRLLVIICSTKILFTTAGMEWLYRAEEEYGYMTFRQTIFQVFSLVFLFTLVKTENDYHMYAGIGVFANVGANIFNFIYSRRFIDLFDKSKLEIKKHIKKVFTFFGITCAGKINSALDAVMLGFIIDDTAVGIYSAAIKINRMVIELITSAVSSFMPRSSYYLENNNIDGYKKMVGTVCNATFFFAIPAATGLFILCEPIIILFSGNQYLAAVPSMKIMSAVVIASCANSFLLNLIITPQGKEKFTLIAQIIAACTNIIMNALLIPHFEVFGAALATLVVELILPIVVLIPAWKYIAFWKNFANILKSIFGSIAMFLVLSIFIRYVQNNFLKIICSVSVGSFTYAVAEIALKHETALLLLGGIRKKIGVKK